MSAPAREVVTGRGETKAIDRPDAARLKCRVASLLRELAREGRALPRLPDPHGTEDPECFDCLDLVVIAAWLAYWPARDLAMEPQRSLLTEGLRLLGTGCPETGSSTLDDLAAALVARDDDGSAISGVKPWSDQEEVRALADLRTRTAFPGSMRLQSLFCEAAVVDALKTALLAPREDGPARQRLSAILDGLRGQARTLIDDALPRTFATRLAVLVAASGLSLKTLAKTCGTNVQLLRRLMSGTQPRQDMSELAGALEGALGATRDSLLSLATGPRLRVPVDDRYTHEVRHVLKVASVPSSFLPDDWEALEDIRKGEVIDWIYDNVVYATPSRRMSRIRYKKHRTLPSIMACEFDELKAFKTADVPSVFDFPRKKKIARERSIVYGGRWRDATARTALGYVLRTLSGIDALGIAEDWKASSGLGYLVHPGVQSSVADTIARERCNHMAKAEESRAHHFSAPKSGLVYAEADLCHLETIMGFFSPYTGYLYHRPPVLVPIPGLIDPAWVANAHADWPGTVKSGLAMLRNQADEIAESVRQIRDPWLPIGPILDMDRPLTPLLQALDRMERERPAFYGTPMAMALHDRDHLLVSLLLHAKLRRANYNLLTWRSDNTGNLRWNFKGYWQLVISQKDMKNEGSHALPDNGADLILVLDPEDRSLYAAIERYLGVVDPSTGSVDETGSSRRLLHGVVCSDHVFPGRIKSGGIDDSTISSVVMRFSARYLTGRPWDDKGIPGVIPFGAHAIRDIVATHYIKNTGSLEEAARALFDTVETLKRHYARFTSEEKSRHSNAIMRRTTSRA